MFLQYISRKVTEFHYDVTNERTLKLTSKSSAIVQFVYKSATSMKMLSKLLRLYTRFDYLLFDTLCKISLHIPVYDLHTTLTHIDRSFTIQAYIRFIYALDIHRQQLQIYSYIYMQCYLTRQHGSKYLRFPIITFTDSANMDRHESFANLASLCLVAIYLYIQKNISVEMSKNYIKKKVLIYFLFEFIDIDIAYEVTNILWKAQCHNVVCFFFFNLYLLSSATIMTNLLVWCM